MRRIMVNTFSPDSVFESFSSDWATRRTRAWSMPSVTGDRFAIAFSYWATIRLARSRSAARIDRPAGPSSSTGRAAIRPARVAGRHAPLGGAHDAEVDHALPGGGGEAPVGRRQAGVLERVGQLAQGLGVVDPA